MFVAGLSACSNKDLDNEVIIPSDNGYGYIQFDTELATRGELITDAVLQKGFAVYGYQYNKATSWNAAKVQAKPNVFDSAPEIVNYRAGFYEYAEPQAWTGNKYSFFGYYPAEHANIAPSSQGQTLTEGDPYITYTLASRSDSKALVDVMTASYIDTDVNTSKSVLFHMYHRLSAIDVAVRNYYEYESPVDGTVEDVTIEFVSLSLAFENLVNESVKLYLDRDIEAEYTPATNKSATYQIVSGNSVSVPNSEELKFITTNKGDDANVMIVIPQEELLHVTPYLTYRKKLSNGTYLLNTEGGENFTYGESLSFDRPLVEGRRYYIQFTFTSDAVSADVIAADEWDDMGRVDYEFE